MVGLLLIGLVGLQAYGAASAQVTVLVELPVDTDDVDLVVRMGSESNTVVLVDDGSLALDRPGDGLWSGLIERPARVDTMWVGGMLDGQRVSHVERIQGSAGSGPLAIRFEGRYDEEAWTLVRSAEAALEPSLATPHEVPLMGWSGAMVLGVTLLLLLMGTWALRRGRERPA